MPFSSKIKITWIVASGFGILIILIFFGSGYNFLEINKIKKAQEDIFLSTEKLYMAALKERKISQSLLLSQKWLAPVQEEMSALLLYLEASDEDEQRRLYKKFKELNDNILTIGRVLSKHARSEKEKKQIMVIQKKQKALKEAAIEVITAFDGEGEIGAETKTKIKNFQTNLDSLAKKINRFHDLVEKETKKQNQYQTESFTKVRIKVKQSVDISNYTANVNITSAFLLILLATIIAVYNHKKLDNYSLNLEQTVANRTQELKKALNDLKQSQDHLIQSEKMVSLGQLVAGVAHEINTPVGVGVTGISHIVKQTKGITGSFKNRTAKKEDFEEYFEDTLEAGELILKNLIRTSELIKSFKMVSADQTSQEKRKFNVSSYLKDIILSLKPHIKKTSVDIKITCNENINIYSHPGAFFQVITNLLMNSLIHAYDIGDTGNILIDVSKNKNGITLIYSDDGKGIPKKNLKKIFDPFFTTNRASGGTGLGLHIVYNIVDKTLMGMISCESVVKKGTKFTITLPITT